MVGPLLYQLTLPTFEQLTNYRQSTAVHNYSLHSGRTVIISFNIAHLWAVINYQQSTAVNIITLFKVVGPLLSQLMLPTSEQLTNYQQSTAVVIITPFKMVGPLLSQLTLPTFGSLTVLNSCTKLLPSQR